MTLDIKKPGAVRPQNPLFALLPWASGYQAAAWRGLSLFKFMASGLPSFLVAVPLNVALVEWAHWNKSLVYALLMVLQVSVNFFICRRWVFGRRDRRSLGRDFRDFFTGIMLFRCGDWLLYTLLVFLVAPHGTPQGAPHYYYLAVQCGNVLVFGVLKFLFSERLFQRSAAADAAAAQGGD